MTTIDKKTLNELRDEVTRELSDVLAKRNGRQVHMYAHEGWANHGNAAMYGRCAGMHDDWLTLHGVNEQPTAAAEDMHIVFAQTVNRNNWFSVTYEFMPIKTALGDHVVANDNVECVLVVVNTDLLAQGEAILAAVAGVADAVQTAM